MATIIQQPGFGDEIRRGLAPLLQALQFHSQRKLEQARLETDQMRAAQQIAESRAREAEIRGGLEQTQRDAKGTADATTAFQELLDNVGGDADNLTQEMLTGALAKLKTPEAVAAFQKMWPGYQASIDSLFNIQRTGREAEVAPIAQDIRVKALTAARDLLLDPNAKMPTDPNMMQAVGMAQLEVLDFVIARMRVAAQQADANAQADMFARQAAMEAYRAGIDEWNRLQETFGTREGMLEVLREDLEKDPADRVYGGATNIDELRSMTLDRVSRTMIGISLEDLRKITGDNTRKFGGLSSAEEQGLADIGFMTQRVLSQLPPRLQTMIASDFPADEQEAILRGIVDVAGGLPAPTLEVLGQFHDDPQKALRVIRAGAQKIRPVTPERGPKGRRGPVTEPAPIWPDVPDILAKISTFLGTSGRQIGR